MAGFSSSHLQHSNTWPTGFPPRLPQIAMKVVYSQSSTHPTLVHCHTRKKGKKKETTTPQQDSKSRHTQTTLRRLPELPLRHLLLPIPPIPRRHIDAPHIIFFEASIINIVALGKTPRNRQRRNAAHFAKHVLRRSRSESVNFEIFFAVEGFERGFLDDEALEA